MAKFHRSLLAIPLALMAGGAMAGPITPAETKATNASLGELVEFLRLPNVTPKSSADIRANAAWLEAKLKAHGWKARQLPDGDTPMVWGEWAGAGPKAPTVLFYAHMDGQPVNPKEWKQADPFTPVLRACANMDTCATLPLDQLSAQAGPQSDARLFARSAADDKAPIMMLIAAVDAIKASGRKPAVNIRFIADSHEEGGPPTLAKVVADNRADLAGDVVVMLDGPMHASNKPTVVFGHRGGGGLTIKVYGPSEAMHSGHYGNVVPNPAQNLTRLIASFKDADGKVTLPGYYDGIDPAFKAAVKAYPVEDDEAGLLKRAGVAKAEGFVPNYREAMAVPTLNLVGLFAGSGGVLDRSIIPADASAALDLRTVPGVSFDHEFALIRAQAEAMGFHLIEGAPTAEDRARYPLLATIKGGSFSKALFTDPAQPMGCWLIGGLKDSFGGDPVVIPLMGGGVPTEPLVRELKAPVVILPLVNLDDNQHAANENLRLGNYAQGVHSLVSLMSRKP
ncbi:M20/M25/M40 family metallo-hydrolase [Novosphingobium sp. KACC 22771]|uniref:M20/M25/M40 family metallo-hydrolase n=1 Tax=Novosphingobium sp. KACC 22771 TaxID=3025670 RepID=UPI0023656C5F|nr:M20/M25/M40 family metallo-hydrolase [Novosphingobium sp. KACC 22771]WDF74555.1 M20/M25/M40 family metallo-hydrolase [Novosphingobium sp. KACC 22771]